MSVYNLPFETLVTLFTYLGVSDLLAASCVSRLWREAASILLVERVTIMVTDDAAPAVRVFQDSSIPYRNWVFKEVDLCSCEVWGEWWLRVGREVQSLGLHSTGMGQAEFTRLLTPCKKLRVLNLNGSRGLFREAMGECLGAVQSLRLWAAGISQRDFMYLLQQCSSLEDLWLDDMAHLLMPGTLLSNPEDINVLSTSLRNVTRLHLACSRYLTDTLFSRIISVVGPLRKLSLAGCQISYHEAIYKRFYPEDGRHILKHIEAKAATLKEISLGRTLVDSEGLHKLSTVPKLQLESLHLMSCEQLTKSGIQLLCENQKGITDLDLSLCSRITDYAVLAICQHLPHIKKLNLRRCQGITENGIKALSQLRFLEELNISHLEAVNSVSVEEAIGKEVRPSLSLLNLASLSLEWKVIANLAIVAPNLTHLDVSMCISSVNDRSVQALCRSLKKLQILNMNGCTIVSDIGLAGHSLGQNEPSPQAAGLSLETLGIRDLDPLKVQLGSKAEQTIRQESEVTKYLSDNIQQITTSSEYGLSNLKGLRELNLCGCKKLTNITLVHTLKFQELRYLNLSHCQGVGEEGLMTVAQNCPGLEVLMLAECGHTSDQAVLVISHFLKRIKTLDLQSCAKLTDDALDSLSNCLTLQYLDVSNCFKMSLEKVRLVQERNPRLLNLHHRGIKERVPEESLGRTWWARTANRMQGRYTRARSSTNRATLTEKTLKAVAFALAQSVAQGTFALAQSVAQGTFALAQSVAQGTTGAILECLMLSEGDGRARGEAIRAMEKGCRSGILGLKYWWRGGWQQMFRLCYVMA
ncbi:F-box/LRR-repeat protein 2 [Chionoecetes opilio]|uniref:F-box/LRR-repeat protein 2 n=1 Tax=Chionoecetes opilio TaxID=41210 RepID=A0A8J5D236_CHIOP|nr:F-box/LRR-repeat protein 2 [Chionoecetes opilio]